MWTVSVTLIRLGLGCIFLYVSIRKLQNPYEFLSTIYDYSLVGPRTGLLLAKLVPWFEAVIGASLLCGTFRIATLLCANGLLLSFAVAKASVVWRGLTVSCGCVGGDTHGVVTWTNVAWTCSLFAVGAAAMAWEAKACIAVRGSARDNNVVNCGGAS